MAGLYSKYIRKIHFTGDVILINASYLASFYLTFGSFYRYTSSHYFSLQLYFNLAWLVAAYLLSIYKLYRVMENEKLIRNILRLLLFYFVLIEAFNNITQSFSYSRKYLILTYSLIAAAILVWRVSAVFLLRFYRKSGYNYRRVVIAGLGDPARELQEFFDIHPEHGYRFLGFFDDKKENAHVVQGRIEEMERFVLENEVDEIYCSITEVKSEQLVKIIDFADKNFVRVKLLPDAVGINYKNFKIDFYDHLPVFVIRSTPLDEGLNKFAKRIFDLAFSSIVCVFVLSWLLPLLAIIIKLDSKGPVFFKQKRSGINNNLFWCLKLRTMYVNGEANLKQATKDDPRITPVGRYLRKFNLDELPQFLNVLAGNMSIVGPRPHMQKHTEEYSQIIDKYMIRHYIKPGITGLSQVKGYRGETTEPVMMKNRVKIDIFYLENWSFLLDMKIVFLTIYNMIVGDEKAY